MSPNVSREFFEQKYTDQVDPWNFMHSKYEQEKYRRTLDILGNQRFKRVLEPGCSEGELTKYLAEVSESVDAFDFSEVAIERAKKKFVDNDFVQFQVLDLEDFSVGSSLYDLCVFSEIGYYFSKSDCRTLVQKILDCMAPSGRFLAVHWLGQSSDHVLSGHEVHEVIESFKLKKKSHFKTKQFVIDDWQKI